ncbi:UV damage repair protein UvrX [Bacillus pfraonensis]
MQKKLARTIHLSIGSSKGYDGGFRKTHTFSRTTNLTMEIYHVCTYYLHTLYTGDPIRTVSISLTNLVTEGEEQISLFDNVIQREKEMRLTRVMDEIRTRFGKNSILWGVSYTKIATVRYRNTLLGGHKS